MSCFHCWAASPLRLASPSAIQSLSATWTKNSGLPRCDAPFFRLGFEAAQFVDISVSGFCLTCNVAPFGNVGERMPSGAIRQTNGFYVHLAISIPSYNSVLFSARGTRWVRSKCPLSTAARVSTG